MAVIDVLHDIAPQFTDDIVNARFITYAEPQVSEDVFNGSYELATAYLTAHLLTLASRSGSQGGSLAGFLNNIKEGDRALGYTAPQIKDVDLFSTIYGVEFVRLRNMFVIPIMITNYP